jgi:hypothetical protein
MTSSLAKEQERLRRMAEQELRTARQARSDVLFHPDANAQDKAVANAVWYATIRKAARDGVLTPIQIQETALLSRQRYHQIVHVPPRAPGVIQPAVHDPAAEARGSNSGRRPRNV